MPLKINLSSNINNASLQVGDTAYYTTPTTNIVDNSNTTTLPNNFINDTEYADEDGESILIEIGEITEIGSNFIRIEDPFSTPAAGDFLMFSKDKSVNNTSLLGYYAEVKLSNNSIDKAELFTLGSEIVPSSK